MTLPAIHVLIGSIDNGDEQSSEAIFATEYDKIDAAVDMEEALRDVGYETVVRHELTLSNYGHVIGSIAKDAVLLNLCDGIEVDGYPGISVLHLIEKEGFRFTGPDSSFFDVTTSKPVMKQRMIDGGAKTSPFVEITSINNGVDALCAKAARVVGFPMIVKPSISYASVGLSDASVVWDVDAAREQVRRLLASIDGSVFVERFLVGREFSALVVGDAKNGVRVFEVLERVFSEKLKPHERFQTYKRLWASRAVKAGRPLNGCGMPAEEDIVLRKHAPTDLQARLKACARDAYLALGGNGYARVDIRADDGGELNVLEVNAMCGISFSDSTTGEILKFSNVTPQEFVQDLVQLAQKR